MAPEKTRTEEPRSVETKKGKFMSMLAIAKFLHVNGSVYDGRDERRRLALPARKQNLAVPDDNTGAFGTLRDFKVAAAQFFRHLDAARRRDFELVNRLCSARPGGCRANSGEGNMHQPVLLEEVIELMGIKPGGRYIDGTVGAGGHAEAIMEIAGFGGRLLGIDRDAAALARTAERLSMWGSGCALEQGDFADMIAMAERHDLKDVDGILLDLGMSSDQVDAPERGFSFLQDGPLDMRMDFTQELTAVKLVNETEERTLADILWRLGEESASRRIAKLICSERQQSPIETTGQLADLVIRAKGGRRGKIHPATKTFQALRMAVNSEQESLEAGLEAALNLVAPRRARGDYFVSQPGRPGCETWICEACRQVGIPAGRRSAVGRRAARRPLDHAQAGDGFGQGIDGKPAGSFRETTRCGKGGLNDGATKEKSQEGFGRFHFSRSVRGDPRGGGPGLAGLPMALRSLRGDGRPDQDA